MLVHVNNDTYIAVFPDHCNLVMEMFPETPLTSLLKPDLLSISFIVFENSQLLFCYLPPAIKFLLCELLQLISSFCVSLLYVSSLFPLLLFSFLLL